MSTGKLKSKDFDTITDMELYLKGNDISYFKFETLNHVDEKTLPFPIYKPIKLNKTKIRLWYTENETSR